MAQHKKEADQLDELLAIVTAIDIGHLDAATADRRFKVSLTVSWASREFCTI